VLYISHARVHMQQGELNQAQAAYEVALRFDGRSLDALCGLAQVLLKRNVVDEARRVLGQAMQIDAEWPHAHKLMGELHLKSGSFDQAAKHFQLASEHDADRRRYRR
jgi:cytochrome c-type biogenesis protein CcmH/NrfG